MLMPHQQEAVNKSPNKWSLWFKQRCGKTPTSIVLASQRARSCMVIVPKSIKTQWEGEIKIWNKTSCNFFVITKERFRLDHERLPYYEAIIIDEVHRQASNYKNKFFKALMTYLKKYPNKYIWLLSGTPYTSSAWAPYSYKTILGQNPNWFVWNNKYFIKIKMGRFTIPKQKQGMESELQKEIASIGTIVDLKDVAEVIDDEYVIETFDINTEQKQLMKTITDFTPIVLYSKYHQIESGVLKSDGYTDNIIIECDKDKRVLELAEDEDKIIFVVKYLNQVEKYRKLLSGLGKDVFVISGQEKATASEVAKLAQEAEKAIVIIQADTSDGYMLSSFNTMVFVSMSYSFVNYDQIKYRIKSMDKKIGCTYIHLLTNYYNDPLLSKRKRSLDRAVYDCVRHNEDFSIELYEKKGS